MNPDLKSAILRVIPFIIVLIILNVATKKKKINAENFFINKPVSYSKLFFWWFFFLLYVFATEFIFFRKGVLDVTPWNHSLLPSIIIIIGSVILAPILEELLFRGLLLQRLKKWKFNEYSAVIVQAVVFVLMHSFTYENTTASNIGMAQTFVDGCLFAIARISTKSILTPVAMHSTGNLIAILERFILC
ncbi:MAG: CPBP family intramembrane metalloprotease [Niabella sp.]